MTENEATYKEYPKHRMILISRLHPTVDGTGVKRSKQILGNSFSLGLFSIFDINENGINGDYCSHSEKTQFYIRPRNSNAARKEQPKNLPMVLPKANADLKTYNKNSVSTEIQTFEAA